MQCCKIQSSNILELLENGIISCVTKQDWYINRITPEFINPFIFRKQLTNYKRLLHLGIGNGECYKFFENNVNQYQIDQTSVSDKLYFDPCEIIQIYLIKCGFTNEEIDLLTDIMRNEYLIAISFDNLFKDNKSFYSEKDYKIVELLHSNYDNLKCYSYNILLLLLYILNKIPRLLLPCSEYKQRFVTPMGKKIVEREITRCKSSDFVQRFIASITLDDVCKYLLERYNGIKNIYLADFQSIIFEANIQFDYIFASRSDAFLREGYTSFLLKILRHLESGGFYISDGILNCYDYKLRYRDLLDVADIIGKDRIYLVRSDTKSLSIPIRDISGIIVAGDGAIIENIYPVISKKRILSLDDAMKDYYFLRQCAWSDIVTWSNNKNVNLENIKLDILIDVIENHMITKFSGISAFSCMPNNQVFECLIG